MMRDLRHVHTVPYEASLWRLADERARALPVFDGSHRGLAANQVGCLGELVARNWLAQEGIRIVDERVTTTHDFRLPRTQLTIEVKTKDRTVQPRLEFDCTAPAYNFDHQATDLYLFASVTRLPGDERLEIERYREVILIGGIAKTKFRQIAKYWRTGEVDPTNGTEFWTDCWNVYIKELTPLPVIAQRCRDLESGKARS